jgi:UDP-N-acetyl-D-glucosamine dehydrogenase
VPQYLEAAARQHGFVPELIGAARRINQRMPEMVVEKLVQALAARGKELAGARVLLVGITYKPDIADIRESAAVRILEELVTQLAQVVYHDPLIPSLDIGGSSIQSVALTPEQVGAADAVLLLTAHTSIDYARVVHDAALVLDTHSGLRPRTAPNVLNIWVPSPVFGAPEELMPAGADPVSGVSR